MKTIIEGKRGCGYRKPGGLYLFCGDSGKPCGKLPIPVHVCPTCGNGVKAGRGFQWIKWEFIGQPPCVTWQKSHDGSLSNCVCPLSGYRDPNEKLGLMWVGGSYYPTTEDFMKESRKLGISKRIPAVPNDFVLGKTWVALAHRQAITKWEEVVPGDDSNLKAIRSPGIFSLFLPTEVQFVVTGNETDEQLAAMEKRGITPVNVVYQDEEETVNLN